MQKEYERIIDQAMTAHELSTEEIEILLACGGMELELLFAAANKVRQKFMGDAVQLRGLIEFSNYCERNCSYCGLRESHKALLRYRMDAAEILVIAGNAVPLGYKTVVLQSGEDSYYSAEMIAVITGRLKEELGLAVTLSLGERTEEDYRLWREAGADRYLLKHETADPELYGALHPDMAWENRKKALYTLRELGYQVGSGCMVGLPGQTLASLAADVLLFKELDVEMAGIGPFIPNPNTPLGKAERGTVEMTLKMIAVTRLLLPQAHLPATTALGSIDGKGRQKALVAGANVVMPNITPNKYRRLYEIYPNKICLDDNPAHCRNCIGGIISSLGRTVSEDAGHSPKKQFTPLLG